MTYLENFEIGLLNVQGVGKTTLIMRIYESLKLSNPNLKLQGFYSQEIRQGGERVGFEVVTLDGRRGRLACTIIPRFFFLFTLFLNLVPFSFQFQLMYVLYWQSGSSSVAFCWEIQGGCSII